MPIVEPEVLMDGDHTHRALRRGDRRALRTRCSTRCTRQRVVLEGMLLKPNMVVPGKEPASRRRPRKWPTRRCACLRRSVPAAVPGIVFLSGGQSDEEATANLDAIETWRPAPWALTFSYGRALQAPALKAWRGEPAKVEEAQRRTTAARSSTAPPAPASTRPSGRPRRRPELREIGLVN